MVQMHKYPVESIQKSIWKYLRVICTEIYKGNTGVCSKCSQLTAKPSSSVQFLRLIKSQRESPMEGSKENIGIQLLGQIVEA